MSDLLDILTGGKERLEEPAAAPAAAPAGAKRDPVDYVIRTVYGEADPDDTASRQAVAGVIYNRAKKRGKTYDQVVLEPDQFEPWSDPKARARMEALDPNSATYKAIAADVAPVLSGEVAVPYDHFYAPDVMKGRGQSAPNWDNGAGTKVGTQMFFALGDGGAPVLTGMLGQADPTKGDAAWAAAFGGSAKGADGKPVGGKGPATLTIANGKVAYGDTGQPIPEAQLKTIQTLDRGGWFSAEAAPGSVNFPFAQRNAGDKFQPGQYYITPDGQLKQEPGAESPGGGFGGGLGQGVGDVVLSLGRMLPGARDSQIEQALEANRLIYGASREGDTGAAFGRFTGQIAASAPLIAGSEAALGLGAAKTALAPFTEFMLGRAAGNQLIRASSLAARGAAEGGAAGALTSSASGAPVGDQIAAGALIGAPLGVAAPAAGRLVTSAARGARAMVEPFSETGRNKIVDRFLAERAAGGPTALDITEYVPGSSPTLAQATGNPGLATVERGVKALNPTPFVLQEGRNAENRLIYADALRGDAQTLAEREMARDLSTGPIRDNALQGRGPADPAPIVSMIDQALGTPAGRELGARAPLERLRGQIVREEAGLTPQQTETLTREATRLMGAESPTITRDVMARAREQTGQLFNQVAENTNIQDVDGLLTRLGEVGRSASQELPEQEIRPILAQIEAIGSTVENGQLSGQSYQALTRQGTALDRASRSANPNIRHYAQQVRDALDDALEEAATPEMRATLQRARGQWRNMKVIEGALGNPGEPLDPARLLAQVRKSSTNYAYRGGGDIGDLAEAAYQLSQPRQVLETDAVRLHGLRDEIDRVIRKGDPGSTQLAAVRDVLEDTIDRAAPGYRAFVRAHTQASMPVREQQFLQSLNLTDSRGNLTLGRVDAALKRIEAAQGRSGDIDAKAVSPETLHALHALRTDLHRSANSELGRGSGSDTTQKLATTGLLDTLSIPTALGLGVQNPIAGAAVGLGRLAYGAKNKELFNLLTERLLQPDLNTGLLGAHGRAAGLRIPGPVNQLIQDSARIGATTAGPVEANQLLQGP